MDRRSFIGSILALSVAPAIVKAQSIMRVRPLITGAAVLADPVGATLFTIPNGVTAAWVSMFGGGGGGGNETLLVADEPAEVRDGAVLVRVGNVRPSRIEVKWVNENTLFSRSEKTNAA